MPTVTTASPAALAGSALPEAPLRLRQRLLHRRPGTAESRWYSRAMLKHASIRSAATVVAVIAASLRGAVSALAQEASLVDHVRAHRDGQAAWTVDFAALAGDRSALPTGVFDSGIGGLTVLEAILALDSFHNDTLAPGADGRPDFAGERFVYLGDQANMPYGNYPAAGREAYLRELVLKDVAFLLGTRWRPAATAPPRHDKPPVKAIVIACNTATAYGLDDVRDALAAWALEMPVIGVVEAGARTLAAALPLDEAPATVAVLATAGTCASNAYPRAIASATGKLGKPAPPVVQQGSAALAGAIEGNRAFVTAATGEREAAYGGPAPDPALATVYGFEPTGMRAGGELNSVANYARYEAATLLEAQRRAGGPPIASVVLGCTHYPLVRDELAAALAAVRAYRTPAGAQPYAATVAAEVRFVDPAEATARELFVTLATARLRAPSARTAAAPPAAAFFISTPSPAAPGVRLAADGALDGAYRVGRATGRFDHEDTVVVPLTAATLPPSSAQLVRALPHVWRALAAAEEPPQRSVRERDKRGMRTYYMGFLTRGPNWTPEVTEATKALQEAHLANINRLAEDGRLLIAGPFSYDSTDADQSLRGIFIFDTETRAEAEELAATDPAVKAGRLAIRIIPWYGPYGLTYADHAEYLKKP